MTMVEVDKEEFFKRIGPLDVVLSMVGDDFPYTTKFTMRYGGIVGKTVDSIFNPR
jgi:hypothetical protein